MIEETVSEILAAKPETPTSCNRKIFEEGDMVCVLAGPRMWHIEAFVKAVSKRAGVGLDWHFSGGQAQILAMPSDVSKAVEMLKELMPALEAASKSKVAKASGGFELQVMSWYGDEERYRASWYGDEERYRAK